VAQTYWLSWANRIVSSGERLYRISGEGLFGWNLLIPANQAIRISGWVRP
jgi:hypothetical protein